MLEKSHLLDRLVTELHAISPPVKCSQSRKMKRQLNLSPWPYLVLRLVPLVSLAGAGFRVFWFLTGDGAGVGAAAATAFSGADLFLLLALLGGWVFSCTDGWGCFFFFSRVFRRLILVSSFLRAI